MAKDKFLINIYEIMVEGEWDYSSTLRTKNKRQAEKLVKKIKKEGDPGLQILLYRIYPKGICPIEKGRLSPEIRVNPRTTETRGNVSPYK